MITGDAAAFFRLMVERDVDAVAVDGDVGAVRAMLAALPPAPREAAHAS